MMAGASSLAMRPASFADLDALVGVDARCFPPAIAYPPQEMAALLRARNSLTLVAERSQIIAGFAALRLLRRLSQRRLDGELITIDVLPEFRREHIGWQLYQALETWLRAQGAARVELHVAIDNSPAIGFYQRLGYGTIARVPRYYAGALDAWKMEKMLDGPEQGRQS